MAKRKSLSADQQLYFEYIDKAAMKEQRICFGIAWFTSEQDAMKFDRGVRAMGRTYNGGFSHGLGCGRDSSWDTKDEEGCTKLYAVTY